MSEWIDVNERQPDNHRLVIGYLKPAEYPRSRHILTWYRRGWWGMFSDFEGHITSGEIPDDEITHWMELPEAPLQSQTLKEPNQKTGSMKGL